MIIYNMNIALLLAGGSGTRLNADLPKQFLLIGNTEMFVYSFKTFCFHPMIDKVVLVCEKNYIELAKKIIDKHGLLADVVAGGNTRQQSVYSGLSFIKDNFSADSIVSIHDTARPFVSEKIISSNIEAATEFGACTTAIPTQDTILVSADSNNVNSVPNRDTLYLVQTPQTFQLSIILKAHENSNNTQSTDDAGILVSQGTPVKLVLGDKQNFKVTTKEDLLLANALIME